MIRINNGKIFKKKKKSSSKNCEECQFSIICKSTNVGPVNPPRPPKIDKKFCFNCGIELKPEMKFCPSCGTKQE